LEVQRIKDEEKHGDADVLMSFGCFNMSEVVKLENILALIILHV
jgi:hypothetical protein